MTKHQAIKEAIDVYEILRHNTQIDALRKEYDEIIDKLIEISWDYKTITAGETILQKGQ